MLTAKPVRTPSDSAPRSPRVPGRACTQNSKILESGPAWNYSYNHAVTCAATAELAARRFTARVALPAAGSFIELLPIRSFVRSLVVVGSFVHSFCPLLVSLSLYHSSWSSPRPPPLFAPFSRVAFPVLSSVFCRRRRTSSRRRHRGRCRRLSPCAPRIRP